MAAVRVGTEGCTARPARASRLGRLARIARTVVGVALLAACASPTLPLPPPSAPSIASTSEPNVYHLTSTRGVEPGALVLVVNRNEAVDRDRRVSGTIADERGSWELDVFANVGDALDISQDNGEARSPTTTVTVR